MTSPNKQPNYENDPADCFVCRRRAHGIGLQQPRQDPKWLCTECALIVEHIKDVKRFDPYENRAFIAVDEKAGEFCASLEQTDMALMDETERGLLWRRVVQVFGDELRRLIRSGDAPF